MGKEQNSIWLSRFKVSDDVSQLESFAGGGDVAEGEGGDAALLPRIPPTVMPDPGTYPD